MFRMALLLRLGVEFGRKKGRVRMERNTGLSISLLKRSKMGGGVLTRLKMGGRLLKCS